VFGVQPLNGPSLMVMFSIRLLGDIEGGGGLARGHDEAKS